MTLALTAHSLADALSDLAKSVPAPEPTFEEMLEELEYQLSDAEYRREVAERKSDPFMRQRELDRWSHRIMHINAQIKVLKGGM